MIEPWLLAEGADSDGRFIVKLNGRFRNAREREVLPVRVSRDFVSIEIASDVEWDEYCSYLQARPEGPFERLRRWWNLRKR